MIDKLAMTEAKALIRTHSAIINAWASADTGAFVPPEVKEAILTAAARLYEIIEELPEAARPTMKTDMKGLDVERT